MLEITPQVVARFWSKVQKDGPIPALCPELGACWLWTAARTAFGHGWLRVGARPQLAHRVSYEINVGPIPEGSLVLHRCEHAACVRHLYAGTQKDNMRDRDVAGRHGLHLHPEARLRGERNPATKLTEREVEELRAMVAGGATQRAAALQFGIGQAHVSRIVHRQRRAS